MSERSRLAELVQRNAVFFVAALAFAPVSLLLLRTRWFYSDTLVTTGIFFIFVLGLDVLYGCAGQLSLGHQGFFAIGAYVVAILARHAGLSPWLGGLAGLGINLVVAATLGPLLLRLTGLYFMLGTLAFGIMVHAIITVWHPLTGGDAGLGGVPRPAVAGVTLGSDLTYGALVWALALVLFWAALNLARSRMGRALRAIRSDEVGAAATGIAVGRCKATAFTLSVGYASVAGSLFAAYYNAVHPETFSLSALLDVLLMLFLGGEGTIWGGLLGAALLRLLPEVSGPLHAYKILFSGIVFTAILFLFPRGLAGAISALAARRRRSRRPAPVTGDGLPAWMAPRAASVRDGATVLDVTDVVRSFGGLRAVDRVSFTVTRGQIKSLIGPNGAGKSTLLNLISGVDRPSSGRITFQGRLLDGLSSDAIARIGMARTFQNLKLFADLSVLDNVMVGGDGGALGGALELVRVAVPTLRALDDERALERQARRWLDIIGLGDRAAERVTALPYGHRKLVELARAAAARPVLLMLDEAAAGLNDVEKHKLRALLLELRACGVTVLLVEHDMDFVMGLSDEVVVVNFGRKIAEGAPGIVQKDPDVLTAYLGV